MIKQITKEVLNKLTNDASESDRKRANINIHDSHDASVQRLFISTNPETYIRPHRHSQPHKWEFFTVLDGAMDLLIFDHSGNILERIELSKDAVRSVEIPPNIWHSYVCKKPGTLALEVKEGEYIPHLEEDLYPFSPPENTAAANDYLAWMRTAPTLNVD